MRSRIGTYGYISRYSYFTIHLLFPRSRRNIRLSPFIFTSYFIYCCQEGVGTLGCLPLFILYLQRADPGWPLSLCAWWVSVQTMDGLWLYIVHSLTLTMVFSPEWFYYWHCGGCIGSGIGHTLTKKHQHIYILAQFIHNLPKYECTVHNLLSGRPSKWVKKDAIGQWIRKGITLHVFSLSYESHF